MKFQNLLNALKASMFVSKLFSLALQIFFQCFTKFIKRFHKGASGPEGGHHLVPDARGASGPVTPASQDDSFGEITLIIGILSSDSSQSNISTLHQKRFERCNKFPFMLDFE